MTAAPTGVMHHRAFETITADLSTVVGGQAAPASDEMMPRVDAAHMLTACGTNAYTAARADLLAEQAGTRQPMGPHEARGRALDVCDQGVDKFNARKR